MQQWDIFNFRFDHPIGAHPAVIFSPTNVVQNQDIAFLNVLIVTTVRATYRPSRYDVMLNGADGLDHLSRVSVQPIFRIARQFMGERRGALSSVRQRAVVQKLREIYQLA
jgi:mRNA-degrading endonuclease toxin of MazEF toxin-antitoxin module